MLKDDDEASAYAYPNQPYPHASTLRKPLTQNSTDQQDAQDLPDARSDDFKMAVQYTTDIV